jgi:hypothetical protein
MKRLAAALCAGLGFAASCTMRDAGTKADSALTKTKDTTVTIGKTRLQSFQAKTGSVVVLGFSQVALVPGMYEAKAEIEARELTDAISGTRAAGIAVMIREPGTFEKHETSYVDYDELPSLLAGIDYIGKISHNPTKLHDFQADYRTRGDLDVSTFSGSGGETLVAVKSGVIGGATVFYPLAKLPAFRAAVAGAKALLDSIAPPPSKR